METTALPCTLYDRCWFGFISIFIIWLSLLYNCIRKHRTHPYIGLARLIRPIAIASQQGFVKKARLLGEMCIKSVFHFWKVITLGIIGEAWPFKEMLLFTSLKPIVQGGTLIVRIQQYWTFFSAFSSLYVSSIFTWRFCHFYFNINQSTSYYEIKTKQKNVTLKLWWKDNLKE